MSPRQIGVRGLPPLTAPARHAPGREAPFLEVPTFVCGTPIAVRALSETNPCLGEAPDMSGVYAIAAKAAYSVPIETRALALANPVPEAPTKITPPRETVIRSSWLERQ
jgi:hypothetical protein